ncbi:DUF4962 domain-containing protein [Flavobacterium sp. JAS]|uniref:DUF4962 domain-containing protein n=1 Tax=Flavobacterium sp. JAS TaxID=2897329 RepID=UPI001E4C4972|nr:DUF4962 domain-containing protein [Flavobacterium sp. JAS]
MIKINMSNNKRFYYSKIRRSALLILFTSSSFFALGQSIVSSEQTIDKFSIYESILEKPIPEGLVDENSPWLHFRIPLPAVTKKGGQSELGHRFYYFLLSQDPTFTRNVIKSKPKRWSFFNPYRILENGVWYWKFGYAMDTAPEKITWSTKNYSFTITGNERKVVPPSAEQVLNRVTQTKGPHVVLLKEEIGKLLPEQFPEIKEEMINNFNKLLEKRPEVKIVVDESSYPDRLGTNDAAKKHRFFQLATFKQYSALSQRIESLLRAYLLTGRDEFKKVGLDEFYKLDHEYHTTMIKYGKHPGYPDDFVLEAHVKLMTLILDAFAGDLTDEWRNKIVDLLFKVKKEGYLSFDKQLEFSEHIAYKAHLWQAGVQTLLMSAIVLSPYKEEAKTWLEYVYELWLYRNPAASRNDGGWHEGNGYFGANERQLLFTPMVMGKLMDYDYFSHPWYQNVAKYLSYSNPVGNPGLAFGDGNGYGGSEQLSLIEGLAYLHPENYWNLWRLKSTKILDNKWFIDKVGENEAAWSLLSIWQHNKKPDLENVKPPEKLAEVFPDLGYVGMHSDLSDPSKNMLVNFLSSPFGQLNHGHPAQNAFNVAYGGEPLFWRTGYYNSLDKHKVYDFKNSRAHNTILADGMGQSCDISGYGWIPRFVSGIDISYVLGDASNAYTGVFNLSEKFQKDEGFVISPENGFGNPGVEKFRRHVAMLRPGYVIIYDELEAKQPINWTFRLNAIQNMTKMADNVVATSNSSATATASFFCKEAFDTQVTDQFFGGPAVDWRNRQGKDSKNYPDQWHSSITTKNKLKATRFITIIEVEPGTGKLLKSSSLQYRGTDLVTFDLKGYMVAAQLNPDQPSYLEVKSKNGKCALVTGQAAEKVTLGTETRTAKIKGSTLFIEQDKTGKQVFTEKIDQLPDVLIYGNTY